MKRASRLLPFVLVLATLSFAQMITPAWTDQEKPIAQQIAKLRSLPDDVREHTTRDLALQIRQLPASPHRLRLAMGLASRATEGDFGHDLLQEVAATLQDAIKEQHPAEPDPYMELASLARYEHVNASLDSPEYAAAMSKLEEQDRIRKKSDLTLTDLNGKTWTLSSLKGKVVLLNFWATWCPPCRKEMPDLEALYRRFETQGFVIIGISDEDAGKVKPFIAQQRITYTILLDPGRKVNELFQINGIPKTFVYGRDGNIVAQSIDMRTQKQFMEMLAQAGLK